MIAIRVHKTGGPEVLRLENVPDPEPGPGELVIEVLAIGVNYIEIYQREGQYPLPKPFTPGTEAAGITDVLFGDVAPTGKLPHSWPRTQAQIPINEGDATYDPLFPFGFGLTY